MTIAGRTQARAHGHTQRLAHTDTKSYCAQMSLTCTHTYMDTHKGKYKLLLYTLGETHTVIKDNLSCKTTEERSLSSVIQVSIVGGAFSVSILRCQLSVNSKLSQS